MGHADNRHAHGVSGHRTTAVHVNQGTTGQADLITRSTGVHPGTTGPNHRRRPCLGVSVVRIGDGMHHSAAPSPGHDHLTPTPPDIVIRIPTMAALTQFHRVTTFHSDLGVAGAVLPGCRP